MRYKLTDGWRFQKNGGTWQSVSVPHDAMLTELRTADAPAGSTNGFFPGGQYTYERMLTLKREDLERRLYLRFEGVYKRARVIVNGKEAGGAAYGYIPFTVKLNEYVREGENVIRVETDNREQPDSRWYSGAGIYRSVWLEMLKEDDVTPESVKIDTLSVNPAILRVRADRSARITVLDGEAAVAQGEGADIQLEIANAKLWSCEAPHLYTVLVGSERIEYGIRQITWNKNGFFVNGRSVKLKGGCLHHDNGVIGAMTFDESEERKIRRLKEYGFNAVRSAHNPCSEALLRACDRLGMYVMDEMWDMWYRKKNPYDYAADFPENYREDIRKIVERDYNHPSVILYSIGNEVSEPAEEKGLSLAREMTDLFHELDSSRAATGGFNLMIIGNAAKGKQMYSDEGGRDDSDEKKMSGMNSTMFNMIASMVGTGMNKAANSAKTDRIVSPLLDSMDLAGYNYASGRYEKDGRLHPGRLIYGSETFPQDLAKNWPLVEKHDYLLGDFMWTAWDYIGEAGIGAWSCHADAKGFSKPYPWLLGDTGAFDLLGDPTGEALWARAIWGEDKRPYLAVRPIKKGKLVKAVWRGTNAIPSWSWHGCKGEMATVEVYTRAPRVALYLNGKKLGNRHTRNFRAVFKVKYVPGELRAESLDESGRILGADTLISAKNAHLTLTQENEGEIGYIGVSIADEDGITERNEDRKVTFSITGGELLGFGSANPRTEERFTAGEYTTYNGKALAVIRKTGEAVSVRAECDGEKAELLLK